MPKRPIGDLLRAVNVVDELEKKTIDHDAVLKSLLDRVDRIERRLDQAARAAP